MTAVGDRVRLIRCYDEHTQLAPGAEGTVRFIDSLGTCHVRWDDGHSLGLIPEFDRWEVIPPLTKRAQAGIIADSAGPDAGGTP